MNERAPIVFVVDDDPSVRRAVKQPDERIGCIIKEDQRRGEPHDHRSWTPDGKIFGDQFAKHDVDERDSRKSEPVGDGGDRGMADDAPVGEGTLNPTGHHRLAHPAETETGQRDAKLRGR